MTTSPRTSRSSIRKPLPLRGGTVRGRAPRGRSGFTLIEITVALVVILILARAGSFLLTHFVQDSVYLPNQLNADMLSMDILQTIVEGDATAKGLRNSKAMTSIAATDLTFVNQDGDSVRFRLDTGANILYRSINAGAEEMIPYYLPAGFNVIAKGGSLFTYYDSAEAVTAVAANVRWVTIGVIVRQGAGSFNSWEAQSDKMTAVAVKKMQ